jgi:spore coat polysaccharide biosynthesis predicted glycosyltransferase SpsG
MKVLILAQSDLKAGKGHINRSKLVFRYLKSQKIIVDFVSFYTKKKIQFYNEWNLSINNKLFYQKINEADVFITDEVSCPKSLINLIKNKFVCSISPNGRINKYAKIIFSRTSPIGKYSKKTVISSNINNFLPGSSLVKIKNYIGKLNSKKKMVIGISMGGYDKQNKTLKLLKILLKFRNFIELKILFNKQNLINYDKIINYIKINKINSKVLTMKKNTWNIFSKCSFVFLSGGISAYESVFVGIPSINIINDIKKKKLTQYLSDKNLTNIYKDKDLKKILKLINLYLNNDKILFKQKKKIDIFISKINYSPYNKLLKLIKKHYKPIN